MIDRNEAPEGYMAVDGRCQQCDYNGEGCNDLKVHCMGKYRKDKETVIFKKEQNDEKM